MRKHNAKTQQQPTTDQAEEPRTVAGMTAAEVAMEGRRLATSYLEKRGYAVLERDWRCAAGEVDAVADDEDAPVLVLVRIARRLGECVLSSSLAHKGAVVGRDMERVPE